MALLRKKIEGATLVEVLIAITIIAISFFVALSIYLNVVKSSFSENKLNASILAEEVIVNSIQKEIFTDEVHTIGNFRVEKTVKQYPANERLYVLEVQVFLPNDKIIYTKRQLILDE